MKKQPPKNSKWLRQAATTLLCRAGFHGHFSLHPLAGGINNRVFLVNVDGCSHAVLKAYFHHPDDPRDRLQAEFRFSIFAWKNGVRSLPQPLASDPQNHLGLYEFIRGRQLMPHEITENTIQKALDFYYDINRYRLVPDAEALPIASEACFTITHHLKSVEQRLQNLRRIHDSPGITHDAKEFIRNEFTQVWHSTQHSVLKRACQLGLDTHVEISPQDRRLSPSDFGFHNAILSSNGQLRFIDFEYAGWDDPAKMVCDFFSQPAVPVPMNYYNMFVNTVASDLSDPERYLQRINLLLPVYRLKWCCILLNDFLPVAGNRRSFASGIVDQEERKALQLKKARHALQGLA